MHLTVDPLAAASLSPDTQAQVAAAPSAGLVIVSGPGHLDLSGALAATLASARPDDEVLLAAPKGTRWSVDEAHTDLIDPSRYAPDTHRHVVVADAHRAAAGVHDRFLRFLEEAPAGTTFWFTHTNEADLPPALRGRASTLLLAQAAPRASVAERLRDTHPEVPVERATALLHSCDDDVLLADAVLRFALDEPLSVYARTHHTTTPTVASQELALALAHLAVAKNHKVKRPPVAPVAKKGTAPLVDVSRLTPEAKVTLRRLVETVLSRWERHVAADLGSAPLPEARRLTQQLRGLNDVRRNLVFNTPVPTILAAACAAVADEPA